MYEPFDNLFIAPQHRLARLISNKAAEEACVAKQSDHAPQSVNFEAIASDVLSAADDLYEEMRLRLAAAAVTATTVEELFTNLSECLQSLKEDGYANLPSSNS